MEEADRCRLRGNGTAGTAIGRGTTYAVIVVLVSSLAVVALGGVAPSSAQGTQPGDSVESGNATDIYQGERDAGPENVIDLSRTPDDGLLALRIRPGQSTVLRLNQSNEVINKQTIPGTLRSIQRVDENTYAAVGSRDDDVLVAWIRTDGVIEWTETYGGDELDLPTDVVSAPGGDAYVLTSTESFGVETSDLWVLRVDAEGDVVWERRVEHEKWTAFPMGERLEDGSLIATIRTERSMDKSVDGNQNISAVRIAPNGTVMWRTRFAGEGDPVDNDEMFEVLPAHGDGVLIVGTSNSGNERWHPDAWATRLSSDGEVLWQRHYDTAVYEGAGSAVRTEEGYLLAGFSQPEEGALATGKLIAIDEDGSERFTKEFDRDPRFDTRVASIEWTTDGRLAISGNTVDRDAQQARGWIMDLTDAVEPVASGPSPWETQHGSSAPAAATAGESHDDVVLLVAAALSFGVLFVPYGIRRFRRR